MSRTKSAVAAHVWICGVPCRGCDQRDARAVDAGNGLSRELRHVAEQIDHAAGAGHQPGHPSHSGMQVDLVRFELCGATGRAAVAFRDRAGRRNQPWCIDESTRRAAPNWACRSVDERQGVRAPQLARRGLGDHARLEHHHIAGPHVDLGEHLMGDLPLDTAHLRRDPRTPCTPPPPRTSPGTGRRPAAPRRRNPAAPRRRGLRHVRCRSGRCCARP